MGLTFFCALVGANHTTNHTTDETGGTVNIYWPGLVVLFYALIGLGYTIHGVYALDAWNTRRKHGDQAHVKVDKA